MRKILYTIPFLLLALGIIWMISGAKHQKHKPHTVLIVKEALHSADGLARPETLSVVNEKDIQKLEKFFPGYAEHPRSNTAAGWKSGWRVYFCFPKGKVTSVTVSGNDNGQTWSTGDGDFQTSGDFAGFVAELEKLTSDQP